MKSNYPILSVFLFLAVPNAVQAQFDYTTTAGGATITGWLGPLNGALTIPTNIDGLTVIGIGTGSFYDKTGLTSVTIPGSVTNIAGGAFAFCYSLTAITVEQPNAFYSSSNGVLFDKGQHTLIEYPSGIDGSYTITGNITSIGSNAFEGISLTSVTIPNSVTCIGEYAFYGSANLTSVTIPDSVTNIGDNTFYYCTSLSSVTIPGSVTVIGTNAFAFCTSLTSVTIPGSVTNIEDGAFQYCTKLYNTTLANGVTSIGDGAFFATALLTGEWYVHAAFSNSRLSA